MRPALLIIFAILSLSLTKDYKKETVLPKDKSTVIICTGKYAKRYHNSICRGMKNCKGDSTRITLSEAKEIKLTAYGYCYK